MMSQDLHFTGQMAGSMFLDLDMCFWTSACFWTMACFWTSACVFGPRHVFLNLSMFLDHVSRDLVQWLYAVVDI